MSQDQQSTAGVDVYIPNIDTKILQDKVNECALKGALEVIEKYYTGYDSPYKKALEEGIKNKDVSIHFDIPDILGVINDSIASKFDEIANTAISMTYIPMIGTLLTRVESNVALSDILQEFLECYEIKEYSAFEDLSLSVDENQYSGGSIKTFKIEHQGVTLYEITVSQDYKEKDKYTILGMPTKKYELKEKRRSYAFESSFVTKALDERELKFTTPISTNILADKFFAYLISLKLNDTKITIDCQEFDEDWLPNEDND